MYRNNKTGGFKSPVINHESTSSSKEDRDDGSKSSATSKVRSTKTILHLLKKSVDNVEEEKPKNEERIEKDEIEVEDVKENSAPVAINDDKKIFNVVIGKKSARKHKVWDDDGILEVSGSSAVLKDTEGSVIGRTKVNIESLEEGFRMSIGNKEIEIIDRVSQVKCPPKTETKIQGETVQGPPQKKFKTSTAPFVPLASLKKGST